MASLTKDTTIKEFQRFVANVYGVPNDRHFSCWDMLSNVERFLMRGLKGIRKQEYEKTKKYLLVSLTWLASFANQFHIDLEKELWERFPYLCSYCASCPCICRDKRPEKRQKVPVNDNLRPKTLSEFQKMFRTIYPPEKVTVEHAGIHLAEEMGELSEAVLAYRGAHNQDDFENILLEASDLISCMMGVFNSLDVNVAGELSKIYYSNCHKCHKMPCECSFTEVISFKS